MVETEENFFLPVLGTLGLISVVGFLAVFVNIPWAWSLFMDDTLYNAWMPQITDVWAAAEAEIRSYWALGRFYPVKYLANLLKWKYLPNDPYIFRYFNLSVFFLAMTVSVFAVMRVAGIKKQKLPWFLFLLGSVFLHKPLLEIISLNPLGETWVCFFFAFGILFLFSEHAFLRFFLARLCFVLVALSKEPAALVFFASCMGYLYWAWKEPVRRGRYVAQAVLDFTIFILFFSMALVVMRQGTFTRGAYFSSTPWAQYAMDFFYKGARYALWTSPFVVLFLIFWRDVMRFFLQAQARMGFGAIFLAVFGLGYLGFMSTQGRAAYQEVPAALAFFCLFSLLAVWLLRSLPFEKIKKYGPLLVALFAFSYFISLSRWERFVRGIVEPRPALVNLLASGETLTIVVPKGEIRGHLEILVKEINPKALILEVESDRAALEASVKKYKGQVYVFEFPIYMGTLPSEALDGIKNVVDGWGSVVDAHSYRIYRGAKVFE